MDFLQYQGLSWGALIGVDVTDYVIVLKNIEAVTAFANHLCTYNPEAMAEMKKAFWAGTEDWDTLLAERAVISGRLVLSDFTKETLKRFA